MLNRIPTPVLVALMGACFGVSIFFAFYALGFA